MAKRNKQEPDAVYFLKVLLFGIIGSIWIHFTNFEVLPGISSLPVGLIAGLLFASHEHFQIDRKIEYLVLVGAALLSYIAPIGLLIEI